jgi:hypothetical protein
MALFKNSYASHEHSLEVLSMLHGYDTFLEHLSVIADMGCGAGLDANWWATLTTRDTPPEPHNYLVYAVDQDTSQFDPDIAGHQNIKILQGNFEERIVPRDVDLIWAHDVFQYAKKPLQCLRAWRDTMNVNGMLIMTVPQTTYMHNNKLVVSNYNHQYYSYNILNLMYMLAISGFDCRDAYFYRKKNTPWLYAAVYAATDTVTEHMSWHDLADRQLLNDSVINSLGKYGHARLEDVVVCWLDKNLYQITD